MTTTTCDICNERIHGGRPGGRLTLPSGEDHPHTGEEMLESIDICGPCLAATPGLQTTARLPDLRAAARKRKEPSEDTKTL